MGVEALDNVYRIIVIGVRFESQDFSYLWQSGEKEPLRKYQRKTCL